MKCNKCGFDNPANSEFCSECGTPLNFNSQQSDYTGAVPPNYTQPNNTQPNYGQPNYTQPNNAQPNYGQPNYAQPNYNQPNYTQPNNGQPNYGQPNYAQPPYAQPAVNVNVGMPPYGYISPCSRWLAFVLCFFLGYLGIHRFYAGKIGTGILYILTGGLLGIGWLVDLIMIACGSFTDKSGAFLKQ